MSTIPKIFFVFFTSLLLMACGGGTAKKQVGQDINYEEIIEVAEKAEAAKSSEPSEPSEKELTSTEEPIIEESQAVEVEPAIVIPEKKPSETVSVPESTASPKPSAVAPVTSATEGEVREKIAYANLMFMSKPAKRILTSNNTKAISLIDESKIKLSEAKTSLTAGDVNAAMTQVNESLRLFNMAAILVPSEGLIEEQKKLYETLTKELNDAQKMHESNYKKMTAAQGKEAAIPYDTQEVNRLRKEAEQLAGRGDYTKASEQLSEAQRHVNNAIKKMLDSQTLTYELNVDTPEGEFKYEYERYIGYEELIPIAIEEQKPSGGQLMLVNRGVQKAEHMRDEALKKAEAGDYPVAIRMIMDATLEVRRTLRVMGVKE